MAAKQARSTFLLTLAALIWGLGFVAQSSGMQHIGPLTFTAIRFLIGALVLLPFIYISDRLTARKNKILSAHNHPQPQNKKTLLIGGLCCGSVLFVMSALQQAGLQYTSVGKAGFITVLYIVIVPVLGLFFKKRVPWLVWVAVAIATVGLYLLCITGQVGGLNKGDILVFLCAIVTSAHILLIDYFSPKVESVKLSSFQFLVCGIISLIAALIFESPDISSIFAAWLPLLYTGVMSCGVAYTLQVIGQRSINPTLASLLLSLESVFAVLGGWLLLDERLTTSEALGCVLVFTAIILAQLPDLKKNKVDTDNA